MTSETSLYESSEFLDLWRSFNESYIPWNRFKELPMPAGEPAERVWRAIAALRKAAGTTFDYPPWFPYIEGGSIWFFTPKDSQERLRVISSRSADGSRLARSLAKLNGYHFCQYLMLDEFLAACASDGLAVDREWAHRAALHGMEPQNDGERLFANLCSIFADTPHRFAGRAITFGLIEDISRELSADIQEGQSGVVAPIVMAPREVFSPTYVLDLICRVAQGKGASDHLHPLIASAEISRMFWDLRPLERFNACTELVIRRLFHDLQGHPACSFLAFTSSEGRGDLDNFKNGGFSVAKNGYPDEYHLFGIDGTLYHDIMLRRYEHELDNLETKVDRFMVQRRMQRERVVGIAGLNEREQDVLLELLRNPTGTVTIDGHRNRHKTAYSTAHTDLSHLEELGFLVSRRQSRALAYGAGQGLLGLA